MYLHTVSEYNFYIFQLNKIYLPFVMIKNQIYEVSCSRMFFFYLFMAKYTKSAACIFLGTVKERLCTQPLLYSLISFDDQ